MNAGINTGLVRLFFFYFSPGFCFCLCLGYLDTFDRVRAMWVVLQHLYNHFVSAISTTASFQINTKQEAVVRLQFVCVVHSFFSMMVLLFLSSIFVYIVRTIGKRELFEFFVLMLYQMSGTISLLLNSFPLRLRRYF